MSDTIPTPTVAITTKQVQNLRKMVPYLREMTPEYAATHFYMGSYAACVEPDRIENMNESLGDLLDSIAYDDLMPDAFINQAENSQYVCGTCACVVGHAPAAGIPVKDGEDNWEQYGLRVFGISQHVNYFVWDYLFGPYNENDPVAAADRIEAFLAHNNL